MPDRTVRVLYRCSLHVPVQKPENLARCCKAAQKLRRNHLYLFGFLATPAERGEPRNYNNLPRKVPNRPIIRNQWLTWQGSNFSGDLPTKKKVAGRVAALSDDKQKFNALPDYQNLGNPASSGSEVRS